jgi:hypothetical protein
MSSALLPGCQVNGEKLLPELQDGMQRLWGSALDSSRLTFVQQPALQLGAQTRQRLFVPLPTQVSFVCSTPNSKAHLISTFNFEV